jgi:hypothetical protein
MREVDEYTFRELCQAREIFGALVAHYSVRLAEVEKRLDEVVGPGAVEWCGDIEGFKVIGDPPEVYRPTDENARRAEVYIPGPSENGGSE